MQLGDLLAYFDRTAANLEKLEQVWAKASPYIPTSPAAGSHPAYEALQRNWQDLLPGLPPIDGWTIRGGLPDIDAMGRAFIDYWEIGEQPFDLLDQGEQPGRDLAEYRHRLNRARRRAARERLSDLTEEINDLLERLVADITGLNGAVLTSPAAQRVREALNEVERLVGDAIERTGRWSDLRRHLHFGQQHDWLDIANLDWPSVRADVVTAGLAESDPLPVPDIDLGEAASQRLGGTVSTAVDWSRLTDEAFERLLFDLLRHVPEFLNVQWLMKTRAADRGRDLSLDRQLQDGSGSTRNERVIVQAKHWLSRSVALADVSEVAAQVSLWEPPRVRGLIVATSGRFTADAVAWVERHNEGAVAPHIDLWPDSRLESMLAERPAIAAAYGLR